MKEGMKQGIIPIVLGLLGEQRTGRGMKREKKWHLCTACMIEANRAGDVEKNCMQDRSDPGDVEKQTLIKIKKRGLHPIIGNHPCLGNLGSRADMDQQELSFC